MLISEQAVTIARHDYENGLTALTFAAASTSERAPFVFVLHGMGSRKERHLDLCLRLVAAGFKACVLDAPGHGERWHTDYSALFSSNRTDPAFLRTFARVVAGTTEEVAQIATDFSLSRYGVIGHSMGGFTAMHIGLADRRAHVIVNVSGSIDLTVIPDAILQTNDFRALVQAADPAARASELVPRPVLLLHGDRDELVPVVGARHLYAALVENYGEAIRENISLVELPGVGHEFIPEMARQAVDWMQRFLPENANP